MSDEGFEVVEYDPNDPDVKAATENGRTCRHAEDGEN